MKIGIIGLGVVGGTCKKGFESLGHEVTAHDIKLGTAIENIIDCELVYICVPTPSAVDGSCDTSIVEGTVKDLERIGYGGVVAIKSTITPGTTQKFIDTTDLKICFCPEFLREWCAYEDFVDNHNLLVVGCYEQYMYDLIVESHGHFPKNCRMMDPTEAEILKYYSNTLNAVRVVFANVMYEICDKMSADYNKIKTTFLLRKTASDDFLNVNTELRGYGGACLPKDTKALDALVKQLGLDLKLFETVDRDNEKFKS